MKNYLNACKVQNGGLTVKHVRPTRRWTKIVDRLAGVLVKQRHRSL